MSFVDDVFGVLKAESESHVKSALSKALQSDNWLSVYSLWKHDIQVKHYLEEKYPDIAKKCRKVYEAHSELITTIGEHFYSAPGGIEF